MIYDLQTIIRQQIAQKGRIGFADFMQLALYHPEHGYYMSPDFRLGKRGDFTTAPEISPLFGACIAQLCEQVFTHTPPQILEIGAGSGKLAQTLLATLKEKNISVNYFIYDVSKSLCTTQRKLLQGENVVWLENFPANFNGIIIANEVLDAIPVTLIEVQRDGAQERCVTWKDEQLTWELGSNVPTDIIDKYALPPGYCTEIHSHTAEFVSKVAGCLERGMILFLDYGYGEAEYYHPQRHQGTLTCFHQHQKSRYPLQHPGKQDITSHVNFTQVIDIAADAGCDLLGFTTQAAFLLDCGLMDLAGDTFASAQAVKILTMPTEMGDIIKVMGLGKKLPIKPKGFGLLDRRRDL